MATARDLARRHAADLEVKEARLAEIRKELHLYCDEGSAVEFTEAVEKRCEALFAEGEKLKPQIIKLRQDVKRYTEMADEDDEAARYVPPSETRKAALTATKREYLVGTAVSTRGGNMDRSDERPENAWRYADGQIATVGANERMADHPVAKAHIARTADRDQYVVGMHGNLGSMLRSMSTTSVSAVIPTVWSNSIIDKARNESVCFKASLGLSPWIALAPRRSRKSAFELGG
jgi:hypothetical protein